LCDGKACLILFSKINLPVTGGRSGRSTNGAAYNDRRKKGRPQQRRADTCARTDARAAQGAITGVVTTGSQRECKHRHSQKFYEMFCAMHSHNPQLTYDGRFVVMNKADFNLDTAIILQTFD
jgi:hypothetical protein